MVNSFMGVLLQFLKDMHFIKIYICKKKTCILLVFNAEEERGRFKMFAFKRTDTLHGEQSA